MSTSRKLRLWASVLPLLLVICSIQAQDGFFRDVKRLEGENINTATGECNPSISADGLELYFVSDRPGGNGDRDLVAR